jgi:hypothetical protein
MLEKFGREWIRTEYRINKKGAECFRTADRDEAMTKLAQLQEKRPGIYTLQTRYRRENKFGQPIYNSGDGWGVWS